MNPSVEVHHLVGKISTAETLLTEVQRKVCNVCNQGKTLCSPCIKVSVLKDRDLTCNDIGPWVL